MTVEPQWHAARLGGGLDAEGALAPGVQRVIGVAGDQPAANRELIHSTTPMEA